MSNWNKKDSIEHKISIYLINISILNFINSQFYFDLFNSMNKPPSS